MSLEESLAGLLLGTAVGDSLGLPFEGLSARRINRLRAQRPWAQSLIFGRGMISDDTEHALMVGQSLLESGGDCRTFQWRLASRLRWWLLALPAGVGLATLRAVAKLWVGVSPDRSGVFSAGNGPAMRSALPGAFFAHEPKKLRDFVAASTRLTHTDPRALTGALAVAQTAAWCVRAKADAAGKLSGALPELMLLWRACAPAGEPEWERLMSALEKAGNKNLSVADFAASLGLHGKVTGYIYQTVPVALYVWFHHGGKIRMALPAVLELGGDTDTVGAIVGALTGLTKGKASIPPEWLDRLVEWPISVALLEKLAVRLAASDVPGTPPGAARYFWPAIPVRNLFFLFIVLAHGFRRLVPPY